MAPSTFTTGRPGCGWSSTFPSMRDGFLRLLMEKAMHKPSGQVLVVEDEVVVGMELQMVLTDAGYEVIGPVTTPRSALQMIRERRFQGAVLDLNLNGTMSFDVADALSEAEVPFVLVT